MVGSRARRILYQREAPQCRLSLQRAKPFRSIAPQDYCRPHCQWDHLEGRAYDGPARVSEPARTPDSRPNAGHGPAPAPDSPAAAARTATTTMRHGQRAGERQMRRAQRKAFDQDGSHRRVSADICHRKRVKLTSSGQRTPGRNRVHLPSRPQPEGRVCTTATTWLCHYA